MDIENPFVQYYINQNEELKEYIELYEIPKKEHTFLIEKMMSVDISNLFKDLGYIRKGNLISDCNSLRYLQQCISNPDHKHFRGSFCRDRYCPICSHIKSHKANNMMFEVMKSIQKDNNYKNSSLVFITFTQKNVGVGELKEELDKMQKAIQTMMKKELIFSTAKNYKRDKKTGKKRAYGTKGVVQGTVRHLEVTSKFSKQNNRIEFHPHWHMIMLVKDAYFKEKRYFWDKAKAIKVWRKYMKLDYNPNVDIRKITDVAEEIKDTFNVKLKNMKIDGAIKEVCKYSTKDSDLVKVSKNKSGDLEINWNDSKVILKEMYLSMRNRRDLIFTGAFKKTKERLFGKKNVDELVSEMQDAELIDIFKHKKCRKCGSPTVEFLQRYSKSNKYYYNLSDSMLEQYKESMNAKIKKIVIRKQLKKKMSEESIYDLTFEDDGYNPFEMDMTYEEYLSKKKSDASYHTKHQTFKDLS